jgi:hypothetical protein
MPMPVVQEDLEEGRLARLAIPQMGGTYSFRIARRLDTPLGPATRWLVRQLVDAHNGVDRSI